MDKKPRNDNWAKIILGIFLLIAGGIWINENLVNTPAVRSAHDAAEEAHQSACDSEKLDKSLPRSPDCQDK
jgi:hypothetical protein